MLSFFLSLLLLRQSGLYFLNFSYLCGADKDTILLVCSQWCLVMYKHFIEFWCFISFLHCPDMFYWAFCPLGTTSENFVNIYGFFQHKICLWRISLCLNQIVPLIASEIVSLITLHAAVTKIDTLHVFRLLYDSETKLLQLSISLLCHQHIYTTVPVWFESKFCHTLGAQNWYHLRSKLFSFVSCSYSFQFW